MMNNENETAVAPSPSSLPGRMVGWVSLGSIGFTVVSLRKLKSGMARQASW